MRTIGSTPDPYYIKPRGGQLGLNEPTNLDTYTQVSSALVPGQNTGVFLIAGQSNAANFVDGIYTVTQSNSHMMNPFDGGVYRTKDPVLGCNGSPSGVFPSWQGSWTARLGDLFISAGTFQRVIICNVAAGGTSSQQWAEGGDCNHRLICAGNRLLAKGMQPTRIIWMQGENDASLGFSSATTKTNIWSVCDTLRRIGVTSRMIVSQTTYNNGAMSSATRAGQAASVDATRNIILGPDTDAVTARQSDLTHLNTTGASQVAALWKNAIISDLF